MGSMSYFDQVVQEILQNKYFKTNSENSEIRNFFYSFWNWWGGIFLKNNLFYEL